MRRDPAASWRRRIEVIFLLQAAEVIERLVDRADGSPGDAPGLVEVAEELEVVEMVGRLERPPHAGIERTVAMPEQVHVMLDQPGRPLGDRAAEGLDGGL